MTPADGSLETIRRSTVIDDLGPAGRGGRPKTGIIAEECVETGQHVEAGCDGLEDDRPPGIGQTASGRRDPDEQGVGTIGARERLPERRHDRDVVRRQGGIDVLAGLGRIDDRDDVVPTVADDPERGLAAVRSEFTLGEDHEAAALGRTHRPSVTDSPDAGMRRWTRWTVSANLMATTTRSSAGTDRGTHSRPPGSPSSSAVSPPRGGSSVAGPSTRSRVAGAITTTS